jgi:hypothetical protein
VGGEDAELEDHDRDVQHTPQDVEIALRDWVPLVAADLVLESNIPRAMREKKAPKRSMTIKMRFMPTTRPWRFHIS